MRMASRWKDWPVSVAVRPRGERSSSGTPSRCSSSAMMRETLGWLIARSRAARVMFPVSTTRRKTESCCSRSISRKISCRKFSGS